MPRLVTLSVVALSFGYAALRAGLPTATLTLNASPMRSFATGIAPPPAPAFAVRGRLRRISVVESLPDLALLSVRSTGTVTRPPSA